MCFAGCVGLRQHCINPESAARDGHVHVFCRLYRVAGLTCVKHWVQAWPVVVGAAGFEVVARLRLVAAAALASEAAAVGLQGRPGRRLFAAGASVPVQYSRSCQAWSVGTPDDKVWRVCNFGVDH